MAKRCVRIMAKIRAQSLIGCRLKDSMNEL